MVDRTDPDALRDDGDSAGIEDGVVEVLGVIGPVRDDMAWAQPAQKIASEDHVATLSG